MPYNALEWHVSVQMNVTRAGFAVSYFVSHTCWQPLPQRVNSVNANDGTAAGINALRRLKIKRCGELASRLSSRLTFAYVYLALRGIHQDVNFSEVVRAIHLGRDTPPRLSVLALPCLDAAEMASSRQVP